MNLDGVGVGEPISLATTPPMAGLRFGQRGALPVLALHGWLDNAASFIPLAPLLKGIDLVAIDLPGHGASGHRPPGVWYHPVDWLSDVEAAADALGWQRFVLLGHSLGGAIGSLFATARPQRVRALALIEALGFIATGDSRAVSRLREGMADRHRFTSRLGQSAPRRVVDRDAALSARVAAGGIDAASAALLLDRNLEQFDGSCYWRSDPRLRLTTPYFVAESTAQTWLAAIEAPTLLLAATERPPYFPAEVLDARVAAVPGIDCQIVPGEHHLHMTDPAPVAAALNPFFARVARAS